MKTLWKKKFRVVEFNLSVLTSCKLRQGCQCDKGELALIRHSLQDV